MKKFIRNVVKKDSTVIIETLITFSGILVFTETSLYDVQINYKYINMRLTK